MAMDDGSGRDAAAAVLRFAGSWPPTDPLNLLALWRTLKIDQDKLPEAYLRTEDWDDDHPVAAAWLEVHALMLALEPTGPQAATAIYEAWLEDDAEGFADEWDSRKVELAARLALRDIPRAM